MPENTLFYSKHCKHCKDFILKLKQRGLLDTFTRKICIEDPRTGRMRTNLPPFLKEVPTIIVDDYDQPLASDMAFKWIEFKKKQVVEQETGGQGIKEYDIDGANYEHFGTVGDDGNAYGGLGGGYKQTGGSSVMYQESLLPPDMLAAATETGGKGDSDKMEERMRMARSMDDEMSKKSNSGGNNAPNGMMAYNPSAF